MASKPSNSALPGFSESIHLINIFLENSIDLDAIKAQEINQGTLNIYDLH